MSNALQRYRFLAWIVGVLIVFTYASAVMKYGFDHPITVLRWLATAHGFVYVVYLITLVDLYSRCRWTIGKLALYVVAGLVPVLTFWVERRVTEDVRARLSS